MKHNKKAIILLVIISVPAILGLYALKEGSSKGRLLIWGAAIQLFRDHPGGIGPGNFQHKYIVYQTNLLHREKDAVSFKNLAGDARFAFNDLLQVACERGGVGAVLFLAAIVLFFRALWDISRFRGNDRYQRDFAIGCIGALVVLLVSGLTAYPLQMTPIALLLWCFAAIIFSIAGRLNGGIRISLQWRHFAGVLLFGLMLSAVYLTYDLIGSLYYWNRLPATSRSDAREALLVKFPLLAERPAYLFETGSVYLREADFTSAIKYFLKAQQLSPDKEISYALADCFNKVDKADMAISQLKQVHERYPSLIRPSYELALIYHQKHDQNSFALWADEVLNGTPKSGINEYDIMKKKIKQLMLLDSFEL